MRLPKTITGILIILLALLPCIYCAYFQVREQMIGNEMEEKMERGKLQTIIIPVKEFRWYEENREILVDGTMFDVKSMRREKENYIITGLFDEEETKLHIAMGRLQREKDNDSDASLISILVSHTLMHPDQLFELPDQPEAVAEKFFFDERLYNTILTIHAPPPRSC